MLVLSSQAAAEEWPQWRGPHQNGKVVADIQLSKDTTFKEQWRADVATGFSSMVVSNGLLFTMGNRDDRDIVWCLDAKTGEVVWQHAYDCPLDPNLFEGGPTATPTIANSNVYTLSRRGDLFCFSTKTGEVLWNLNINNIFDLNLPTWGFSGSPFVSGDNLVLNAGSAGLCLNSKTGELKWTSNNDEDGGYSTPLPVKAGDRQLVVMLSAKSLNAVDLETGAVAWSIRWITRYGINAADPVLIDDQHLLVSSGYSKGTTLIKFEATSAEQVWRSRDLSNQMSPGIFLDDHVYAVSGDAEGVPTLVCLDAKSGELKWSEEGYGSASLIAINGQLLILSGDGKLSVTDVSPEGINVLTSQRIDEGKFWTPVCFANSRLYVRNAKGVLVSLAIN